VSAVRLCALGLELVPESPLSHMSDMADGPVGRSAARCVAPHALLPHGVYRAARPQGAHLGAQTAFPHPAVPPRQPDPPPMWPATPGRPARRDDGLAHLGPDAQCPLPPPRLGARGRMGRGRPPLGAHPAALPLPGAGLAYGLPRQGPRGLTPGLPHRGVALCSSGCSAWVPHRLPPSARPALWPGVGSLHQATVRRTTPGARGPGTLSPPHRDGQSSPPGGARWPRTLHVSPSAPRQSGADHDAGGPGVYPAFAAPSRAPRLPAPAACGFLANRWKARALRQCRHLRGQPTAPPPPEKPSAVEWRRQRTGIDLTQCPQCGHGPLVRRPLHPLPVLAPSPEASSEVPVWDSS
jgi:hypothetical protein